MRLLITGIVVLVLLLVSCAPKPVGCHEDAKICPDGTSVARVPPSCEFAQCPEIVEQPPVEQPIVPEVIVADTQVVNDAITVAKVTAAEPGWIAIHADDSGKPGMVAGLSHVGKGESNNVEVDLDPKRITPILYAMLHVDKGKENVYEFPGEDVPATADGKVVSVGFTVEVPVQVEVKEFSVSSDDNEFSPDTINVKKGDNVKITFNFNDGKIYYGGLDVRSDYFTIQYRKDGKPKVAEFTAEKSFTFSSFWPQSGVKKATGKVEVT